MIKHQAIRVTIEVHETNTEMRTQTRAVDDALRTVQRVQGMVLVVKASQAEGNI